MFGKYSQAGVIHLLPLFIVVALAGLMISANIPLSRTHLDGKSNVLGMEVSKANIKIATDGAKPGFISNNDGAVSSFPLNLDKTTGILTVTTPKGAKEVTVLPDAAINNMLASKVASYVTSHPAEGELASTDKLVTLIQMDEMLVYEIDGVREYKLFGLIPVKSKLKAFVSAENGQVVKTEQSLLGRILNRLAP